MLATCYQASGDKAKLREAGKKMVSEAQRAVQQDPSNGAALGVLAGGYALLGEFERAQEWIDRALLVDPDNLNMRYNFACVLAAYVGDTEGAIRLLKGVLPVAVGSLIVTALTDPDLDPVRDDPRVAKMIEEATKRLGIPTPAKPTPAMEPSGARMSD